MNGLQRPLVLVTEGSAPAPLAWLRERAEVIEAGVGTSDFERALPRALGMVVRTYTRVDAPLLARASRLTVVGRGGVGLENIDVSACRARGVEVVYTPEANTQAVVEFVIGAMLRLVRPWFANDPTIFSPASFVRMRERAGAQLSDLRLGILGMGRVGRAVARAACRGFGTRIAYHDLVDVSALVNFPAECVAFEELIAGCDVLSLHVDARPLNHNLIDSRVLSRAGFGWLINTSRGMVVDAGAIGPALRQGRLKGVVLDVFEPEPPPAHPNYAGLLSEFGDRVLLTPHMASRTVRALENMSWVVRDVMGVLDGCRPQFPAPDSPQAVYGGSV